MATKGKDGSLGKEKRGASPSNPHQIDTTQRKRNPKQSDQDSVDHKDHATPSEKQVPHYLRPTISSSTEPFKYVKKHAPDNTTQKPSLNRRGSFDKRTPTRVSSLSPKPTPTSNKPISERTSKTVHRVVKSQPSLSRPNSIKKKETNASISTSKGPSNLNIEFEAEEKESLVTEVEDDLLKVESEVEFPPENKEHVIDVADTDNPKNHEYQNEPPALAQVEETEDKIQEEETIIDNHHFEEKQNKDESDNYSHPEQSVAVETEIKEGEESASDNLEGRKSSWDSKEEVLEEVEGVKMEEAKPVEAENIVRKREGGQGKKESPAYNDVIEETASKLMGKRKTKVKALVGAFETVISLQDPDSAPSPK